MQIFCRSVQRSIVARTRPQPQTLPCMCGDTSAGWGQSAVALPLAARLRLAGQRDGVPRVQPQRPHEAGQQRPRRPRRRRWAVAPQLPTPRRPPGPALQEAAAPVVKDAVTGRSDPSGRDGAPRYWSTALQLGLPGFSVAGGCWGSWRDCNLGSAKGGEGLLQA